jgi:hypothetical protein
VGGREGGRAASGAHNKFYCGNLTTAADANFTLRGNRRAPAHNIHRLVRSVRTDKLLFHVMTRVNVLRIVGKNGN